MTYQPTGPDGLSASLMAQAAKADQSQSALPSVTIADRHMGSGKTTGIIASLRSGRKCLVVVPLLSEVIRAAVSQRTTT